MDETQQQLDFVTACSLAATGAYPDWQAVLKKMLSDYHDEAAYIFVDPRVCADIDERCARYWQGAMR